MTALFLSFPELEYKPNAILKFTIILSDLNVLNVSDSRVMSLSMLLRDTMGKIS